MGTWAVQRDKIPELISELDAFLKRAYNIAGDDLFFDRIGSAKKRLEEMASREWRGCNNGLINLVPVGEEENKEEKYFSEMRNKFEKAANMLGKTAKRA
jgi:hypothetical protein